jgi:hypothetical protein
MILRMTDQTRDLQASASHISLMHRPYGPRVHMDESAVGATPAADAAPVLQPALGDGEGYSPEQALEALLNKRKKSQSPAESAETATADPELSVEGNADPLEEAAPGEGEDADPASKEPPIARPKSWTDAEDAEWQATPRKLQEKIVARELERDTAIRRAQNDAAEKLKGLTAKEQQAEQAKQQYEAKLPALMQALHNTNNTAFSDIKSQDDADLLAVVDPSRWVQWKSHQDRMAQTNFELQQAENGKAAKHNSEWQEYRNKEDALATEKIPDLADPVKAEKLMKRAGEKLAELGFKPEELQNFVAGKEKIAVFDHRFQQLIFDSLALADIRAASKKTVAAVKPLPPVQRPGNAAPNRGAQDTAALRDKLNSTGDVNDAFALYQARKNARRA